MKVLIDLTIYRYVKSIKTLQHMAIRVVIGTFDK